MNIVELLQALEYGNKENRSKVIKFRQKFLDPQKWKQIREADEYQDIRNEIYQAGDYYKNKPLLELPYSLFKLYEKTGSRKEYEKEYFNRRGRLSSFAVLSLMEGRKKNQINFLEDILWAICNEYTWALPAHLDGGGLSILSEGKSLNTDGKLQSFIRDHKYNIDLFSAETAFALAEISFFLEEKLSNQLLVRVREEIYKRILQPYTDLNSLFHWELLPMNWAAVCAGSIGSAAIYLIEESKVLAPIIQRVLNSMEVFLNGFTEDGTCQEGLVYWNYGFGFYTYFADLLKMRTAGQIDLMNNKKVEKIALFQQKSYINGSKVISFSDTPVQVKHHAGLSSYLNKMYSAFELPDIKDKAGFNDDHCYRWPHIIRDLIWFTPEAYKERKRNDNKISVYFLQDAQWLIYKKNKMKEKSVFAAKGGTNNEPHNHNDIGSFIYSLGDTIFLTDLGSGEYTKDYFGVKRYGILSNGSHGHSVPIVEGRRQESGEEYFASVLKYDNTDEIIHFSLEMASVYKSHNLKSLIRHFILSKEDNGLVIKDKYHFRNKTSSLNERFITLIKPEILEKGSLKLTAKENSILILFNNKQLKYSYSKEYHITHYGNKKTVYLLDFQLRDTILIDTVKFKIKPVTT